MIVSWAIENNLVYFRTILARSIIVIVSWGIKNNLVYERTILVGPVIVIASGLLRIP